MHDEAKIGHTLHFMLTVSTKSQIAHKLIRSLMYLHDNRIAENVSVSR